MVLFRPWRVWRPACGAAPSPPSSRPRRTALRARGRCFLHLALLGLPEEPRHVLHLACRHSHAAADPHRQSLLLFISHLRTPICVSQITFIQRGIPGPEEEAAETEKQAEERTQPPRASLHGEDDGLAGRGVPSSTGVRCFRSKHERCLMWEELWIGPTAVGASGSEGELGVVGVTT